MLRAPQTQDEVDETRRIVHNAENVYGLIVSLDDKAALIRANFIEGPPRLQAHLRRRQQEGHRAVRGPQHQDLRRRRAAPLRLGLQLRRRRLLHPDRHLLPRVDPALDVLPRLARRAPPDADRRDRRLLGPRLHPPDRPRARSPHAGHAVPHHGARRQPRHPDARPLLRGVREVAAGTSDAPSSRRSPSSSCRPSPASSTDALGVLVIILVPIVMLQKLAHHGVVVDSRHHGLRAAAEPDRLLLSERARARARGAARARLVRKRASIAFTD